MRKTFALLSALAIAGAAVGASAAVAGKERHQNATTRSVIEHADTDTTTDVGASGDSAGDLLTFANPIYDSADENLVGSDAGHCVRLVANSPYAYDCTWTTFLPGGSLMVQGPADPTKGTTLAISGGTGKYKGAQGTMSLSALANGTKFRYTFHLN